MPPTTFNADQLNPPADGAEPDPAVTGAVTPPGTGPSDAAFAAGTDTAADQSTVQPTPEPVVADPAPAPTDSQVVNAIPADDKPGGEVVEIDEDAESGNVIALADRFEITATGEVWPHDMLEFKGDLLGIRLPLRQALAAFSLASSKYVSLGVKNDLTGLFIARHLSPESYGRVFSRLMDPDETDYDVDTVGELFNAIVTAAVDADKAKDAG